MSDRPFFMDIKVYKIPGCMSCTKMIEVMTRAQLAYTPVLIGIDIPREEFRKEFPNVNSFPHTVIDGKEIGGLTDTVRYLVSIGLLKSRRSN